MGLMGWGRAIALAAAGCSFRIGGPAPHAGETSRPACVAHSSDPAADGIGATIWVALGAVGVYAANRFGDRSSDGTEFKVVGSAVSIGLFGGLAAVHIAAAVRGSRRLCACRAANLRYRDTRARAIVVLDRARSAAQAGDCAAVRDLGRELYAIDQTTYDEDFLPDPEIGRCRASP